MIANFLLLKKSNGGKDFSLPPMRLYCANNFRIYNFRCSITDIIHLLHSHHLIGCLKVICCIFSESSFTTPKKQRGCLLFDFIKILPTRSRNRNLNDFV